MNEKALSKICLVIVAAGFSFLLLFPNNLFLERSIAEMISEEGNKGMVFGRVQHIIKNSEYALFILSDGNSSIVYSPEPEDISRNDFVTVHGETKTYKGKTEIYAYRIVVE